MGDRSQSAEDRLVEITSILGNVQLSPEEKNASIAELASGHGVEKALGSKATDTVDQSANLTPAQKIALITSNLQETLNIEIMEDVINKEGRAPVIYWGTAPTGRPHCGYFVAMLKIAEYLRAGCRVKVLLADLHAFLDNLKAPIELVKYRAQYYKYVVVNLLKAVGVSVDRLEFVLGSSYQLSSAYQMDLLKMCTIVTIHDAKRAGAEVVKQVENATLSGLIYPLMQSLDEQYLGVDAQTGGVDQRKIFTLAKDILPKIGYKERAHLMNPMVPGLAGGKMSASDPDSKIDVLDPPELVTKKIKKAHAVPKEVEGNGVLSFVEFVLLPAASLKSNGKPQFIVERRDAEPLVYDSITKMQEDYRADILSPQNLKPAVTKALNELLAPVQEAYRMTTEFQEIDKLAYPPAVPEKKAKKVKDKGSRHPGAAKVEAKPDGSVEGPDKDQVNLASGAKEALDKLSEAKGAVSS